MLYLHCKGSMFYLFTGRGKEKKNKQKKKNKDTSGTNYLQTKFRSDSLICASWETYSWPSLQSLQLFSLALCKEILLQGVLIKPDISRKLAFPPSNSSYIFSTVAYFKVKHWLWFYKSLYYGGSFVYKHLQLIAGSLCVVSRLKKELQVISISKISQ